MRHGVDGRKLGRKYSQRKALYRGLVIALVKHERIRTTEAKAKELRPFAERLITLSRRGDLASRRRARRHVADREVLTKLFDEIGPRYGDRDGGYTRILKLGARRGDGAELAVIELVESES